MKLKGLVLTTVILSISFVSCGHGGGGSSSPASDPNEAIEGTWITAMTGMVLAEKITNSQITQCIFNAEVGPPKPGTIHGPFAYSFNDSLITSQSAGFTTQSYQPATLKITDNTYGELHKATDIDLPIIYDECGF